MTLALAGTTQRGGFRLEVDLEVGAGDVVGVVGENGAGKTTLLRLVAGLAGLDDGHLHVGRERVDVPAEGVWVPPERRRVGVAFQDPTLFPHLDVRDNVAFGLRRHGTDREAARRTADEWLERLGAAEVARSRPRDVSGGQAQRAALARALVLDPAVLLLDEPLAALDQAGRTLVRRLLRAERRTTLLVTHDAVDALSLCDRLVVLDGGRVLQAGPPVEVTRRPRSAFVARLVGLNLLEGQAAGDTVTVTSGGRLVVADHQSGPVFVTVAPHALALYRDRPEGSPRNTWSAPVEDLEAVGDRVRVALGGPLPLVAEVTPAAVAELRLGPGAPVWASVKATEIDVYPA